MRSDITDRMKKNAEIGRIAMLSLRCGMDISDRTARLVAMTVENPDVGRNAIEKDNSKDALQAVWILDDAENMTGSFSDLEGRLTKLFTLAEKEGYEVVRTDDSHRPFVLKCKEKEQEGYLLYVKFTTGNVVEASFGVKTSDRKGQCYSQKQLEEEMKALLSLIKTVKKLNGLCIKGEEKTLKLAVFACEEKIMIRKARAKRQEQKKQRGSI